MAALREALSDVSHSIWSHWMRYQFSVGTFNEDGTWTMPAEKAERWQRQMNTSYAELPENEKEGDREQADKILKMIDFIKHGEPIENLAEWKRQNTTIK